MLVNNLKVSLGGNTILDNVSFSLNNEEKVGLVGKNGSGKSTLLKTLSGLIEQNSGEINLQGQTVGYLKQEISHEYNDYTILEYIKSSTKIDKIERRMHELEENLNEDNMEEYGDILNKYLELDGYNFEENLSKIVSGLNLSETLDTKIKTLSGGEKIKVLLSALFLQNSDILLLDEPTNNLDMKAIMWLEKYLKDIDKTILMVSHDEVFLQNIANKIFELTDGKIKEYNLKYDNYLEEKQHEYNRKLEEYTKMSEEKDKLKKRLQKAKEWSNKGNNKKAHNDNDKIANNFAKERTNNSNVSKLSKQIEEMYIPKFKEKKPINFFFDFDEEKGNKDIQLNDLVCGYDNFKTPTIDLEIPFGSKLEISGGNGTGKTTLIKTMQGELKPISGNVILGSSVKFGYISQDTLNSDDECSVLEYLTKDRENVDLSFIFILLDKFDISYEDKDKPYNKLSPGERTRVNLVKIALDKTNALILDEVINHLDKDAIDLIYELIESYQGTIISISHNRKYNEILNADMCLDIQTGEIKNKRLTKKIR